VRLIGNIQWYFPWRLGRVVLGAIMLATVLWTSLPVSTAVSGPMCTLACCAGRSPHAADSCMNGSCHAILRGRSKATSHVRNNEASSEQFCGITRITKVNRFALLSSVRFSAKSGEGRAKHDASNRESISAGTFGRTCDPDCGSGLFSFSTQSRPRHAALIAHAEKPRPPAGSSRSRYSLIRTRISRGFGQQFSPRGPPAQSS